MQGMYPKMRDQNGQAVGCIECYLYKDLISDSEYGFWFYINLQRLVQLKK